MTERPRRTRKRPAPQPWCVIAWIVQLPGKPDPLPQPYNERVAPLIRRVNRIFEACDVSFKACEIIALNASQLTAGGRSLASFFAADGSITLGNADARPSVFLQNFVMNGSDPAFTAKMRERCLHLFFVHEMRFQGSAPPERGSGGWFGADTARTCYAMVGTNGAAGLALNTLAQAVAHEFGHALGLSPQETQDTHSTVDNNLMKASLEADDVELNEAGQCETIRGSLTAHIRRGCP